MCFCLPVTLNCELYTSRDNALHCSSVSKYLLNESMINIAELLDIYISEANYCDK